VRIDRRVQTTAAPGRSRGSALWTVKKAPFELTATVSSKVQDAARVVAQTTRATWDHARSKRSRFITLFQAATKSRTNFSCASELP